MLITVSIRRFTHLFVRILYVVDHLHPKRQQGGGGCGTSRYVVIRHDTKIGEINTYDMSSNIKIEKVCEWCGNKFTAQTTVTRFCSKRCSEHSYKERMRQRKIALSNQETKLQSGNGSKWRNKDFLTPTCRRTARYWSYVCIPIYSCRKNKGQ